MSDRCHIGDHGETFSVEDEEGDGNEPHVMRLSDRCQIDVRQVSDKCQISVR